MSFHWSQSASTEINSGARTNEMITGTIPVVHGGVDDTSSESAARSMHPAQGDPLPCTPGAMCTAHQSAIRHARTNP